MVLTNIKKNYEKFDLKIKNKYDQVFHNQDLKNLLGLQIRLHETGHSKVVDENLKKIIKRQFFLKKITKLFLFVYSLLFKLLNKRSNVFLRSFSTSDKYEKELFEKLKKNKIGVLGITSYNKSFINKLKYLINQTWIFDIIERSLEISSVLSKYKCNNINTLLNTINNKNFFNEIITAYEKDIIYTSKILLNLNLSGVLIHSDQTPVGYIFTKAARNNKIKSAVLAHGTLKDFHLVSTLPLHSDKIFVWSKDTQDLINNFLKNKVAVEIKGIKSSIIISNKDRRNIIFASDPFRFINKQKELKLIKLLKKIKTLYDPSKLIFCLHPSDNLKKEIRKKIKDTGWKLSKNSIYREAENAKLVIGGVSSFLFESNQNNIPSIQLIELIQNYPEFKFIEDLEEHLQIDNIPQITFNEFEIHFYSNFENIKFSCNNSLIDVEPIINFFCNKEKFKKDKNYPYINNDD